jgi:hypothetical protein
MIHGKKGVVTTLRGFNQMREILFGAALALGLVTTADAGVVTISLGSGANFNAFNDDALGSTSGTTSTVFGAATWSTTPGVGSQSSEVTDTSVTSRDLEPDGDSNNYVFAQQGGSVTVGFTHNLGSVTIFWGSPDTYNTLTLGNGDVITGTMVASKLGFSANGSNANSMWVTIAAMLMLGFTGLGYAAFRRNAKDRRSVKTI